MRWPNRCPEVAGEDFAAAVAVFAGEDSEVVQAEVFGPPVFDRVPDLLEEPGHAEQLLHHPDRVHTEEPRLTGIIDRIDVTIGLIIVGDIGILLGGMGHIGVVGIILQAIGAVEPFW